MFSLVSSKFLAMRNITLYSVLCKVGSQFNFHHQEGYTFIKMSRPSLVTFAILLASFAVKITDLILCVRNESNSDNNSRQGTVEISHENNFYYFCQEVDAF